MSFKNKESVYRTGSLKSQLIFNEGIKIRPNYYVKFESKSKTQYLRIEDGKDKFTDYDNATPFSEKDAMIYANFYTVTQGIKASVFSCTKNLC